MKNKKSIIKYIIFFLFILIWNLFIVRSLTGDEIWNYGFSNNIYRGLIPYKEFNMVITPLFPMLISIFFYIFGSNILIFHIFGALYLTIMMYFVERLINEKYIIILFLLFYPTLIAITNYNTFTLLLFVIIVWCEKNKKNDLLIGFLISCLILTKQTIGISLILPSLLYFKEPKKIIKRLIGIFIPCTIFLLYLIFNGALYQFINLCFLGLFDFNSSNGGYKGIIFYLTIIVILFNIYLIIKNKKNIYYYYSLCYFIVALPIFDLTHSLLGFTAFLLIYLLNENIKIRINLRLFVYIILIFLSLFYFFQVSDKKIIYPNNINHFEYKLIDNTSINITKKVNNYYDKNKDKKIIFIFGNQGYYFKIIRNEKIEYIDLVNEGNWGYNGNRKVLKYIKEHKNALYIINQGEEINDLQNQTPKEAYKYIKKNAKLIDSIVEKNIKLDVYQF